jgi:hypothetical protein
MGLMGGMCRFSMHVRAPRPYRRRYLEYEITFEV